MRMVTQIVGSICVALAILIILSTFIWHGKIIGHGPVVSEPLKIVAQENAITPDASGTPQSSTSKSKGGGTSDVFGSTKSFNASVTLPPGSALPSEQACSVRINRSVAEPRSDNYTANHTVPTRQQIAQLTPWGQSIGATARADVLRVQITGNFTGPTGSILQWVACKWGINENIVFAEAVVESDWHQNAPGDYTSKKSLCPPGQWDGNGCYQSYGLLQVTYTDFPSAWPMMRDDTAFSAEYMYGIVRSCYEGWTTYLADRTPIQGYPSYRAGDLWGCIGMWYSGGWYDAGAVDYINKVKAALADENWQQASF